MKTTTYVKAVGVGLALALLGGACSDDDSDDGASGTSTVEEVATPQLTFDGTDCTYAGPAEVNAGAVVVELVNMSDEGATIGMWEIDAGYTTDDLAEYLGDPANLAGGAGPEWVLSERTGFPRAGDGETIAWEGDLESGEYVLTCMRNALFTTTPWAEGVNEIGAGLTVIEG